jgi:hypothetical protein
MIHFICSEWAYGTIGNPFPSPLLLAQILTVGWKLGSLLGYKPYHYAVVEAPYPSKAACTSMSIWSTYEVYDPLHMQWMGIRNHRQPVTIALVDPDFDSLLKTWVTARLQSIPLCSGWGSIPIQAACTSMWTTYKVFYPLHMQWQWMGIWSHQQSFPLRLLAQILIVFGWKLGSLLG